VNVRDAAARYISRGWYPIPLKPGTKDLRDSKKKGTQEINPFDKVYEADDFKEDDNLGLLLVPSTDKDRAIKLVAVDFDAGEIDARAVWSFLPQSCGWGRDSKPLSQVLYVSPQEKSLRHVDLCIGKDEKEGRKATLIELRAGPRMQSMAPPSTHPCGEQLQWLDPELDATSMVTESLVRSVNLLATYAMVARWWPDPGRRHHWTLYLGGLLRVLGLTVEEATLVVNLARQHARDPDERDRLDAVQRSYSRAEDDPVAGSKHLIEEMGDKGKAFVSTLRKIWGSSGGLQPEGDKLKANQHNIRKALEQLEVTLSEDKFARELRIQNGTGPARRLDDAQVSKYWLAIEQQFGFRAAKDYFRDVIEDEARRHPFHPVRDYLDSLTWDGIERIDKWLITYGKAMDAPLVRAVGTIVLIAAVRRVRHPGCKFDELLVLESDQGLNKSTALATLCPREAWFSDDLPLGSDAKQMIERTSGRWIIEVAELVGSRRETDHIKASLSRGTDGPVRLAYGHLAEAVERQFIVIGTTNVRDYLKDRSGNRRFWPVSVGRFDVDMLRRDRDQLWAEASMREARGDSIRLDQSLWGNAREEQDDRLVEEPWEEVLANLVNGLSGTKQRISSSAVWAALALPMAQRDAVASSRVSAIMQRMGFKSMVMRQKDQVLRGWGRELVDGIWKPGKWE